jgi:hypothetical protein
MRGMIKITYYKALNHIEIDATDVETGVNELAVNVTGRQSIESDPEKLPNDLVNLAGCLINISERNNKFPPLRHPSPSVVLLNSDQFLLFSASVFLLPEDSINISVAIDDVAASAAFTVPRPVKPYPSWVWVDSQWCPPIPPPNDGFRHSWDEASLGWVVA